MFPNSLAILNQPALWRTDHIHCFQTQLTKSCMDVRFWIDKRPVCFFFSLQKIVWIPRLGSGLMVSEIGLKFTSYSKIFISFWWVYGEVHVSIHACTSNYLRHTKCKVYDRVCKHVIRCTKKRLPKFLILAALFIR